MASVGGSTEVQTFVVSLNKHGESSIKLRLAAAYHCLPVIAKRRRKTRLTRSWKSYLIHKASCIAPGFASEFFSTCRYRNIVT
jgi:hypothetical protein